MYTYVFWGLVIVSLLFIVLAIRSFLRYRKTHDRDDMMASMSVGVAAVLVLSISFVGISPLVGYDSVTYMAGLQSRGPCTVILPFPNEEGLEDEIEVKYGTCEFLVIESEKGRALQVSFEKSFYIEGTYLTRDGTVDFGADLEEGNSYWIHFTEQNNDTFCDITEVRIVHQSPEDFHSNQIARGYNVLEPGWNLVEWDVYRE